MDTTKAEKNANTEHQVAEVIRKRWSPRSFSSEGLEITDIETILEAATWAPSAMNEQPWRFAVARKEEPERFEQFASLLKPGNYTWARNAAALLVVFAISSYSRNGNKNINAAHDVGMATQNLLLQAVSMDIYGHVMEGFDKDLAREVFDLPDEIFPVSMIALGKLGNPEQLDEPYFSREIARRGRRKVSELLIDMSDVTN